MYTLVNHQFPQSVYLKEIDSKLDLLQEESLGIPAEHRAYPDLDMQLDFPGVLAKKTVATKYEPNANEVWPFARAESSQIKVGTI